QNGNAGQLIERTGQFAGGGLYFSDASDALVKALGVLKLHVGAGAVAGRGGGIFQRVALRAKELFDALRFVAVLLNGHYLLAGAQTAVHLAIDASRVLGGGAEVLLATADLKQIEQLGLEVFGGGAAGERAV